ncbi:MAG: hypothetical protein WCK42_09605 [Myxococcaceae bacterium]
MIKKLLVFCLFCSFVQAQPTIRHNNLSINAFSILWGGFDLRYEYQYNSWLTFTVPVDLEFAAVSPLPNLTQQMVKALATGMFPTMQFASGFGARFNYEGFYVEPMIKVGYSRITLVPTADPMNYVLIRPIVYLGYQRTFSSGLSLNVGAGPSFNFFLPKGVLVNSFPFFDVMMGVGYAF